jgi:IMP and pyridine-specific 5'-nucleotidase
VLKAQPHFSDHITHLREGKESSSALKELVSSVGYVFTPLDLREAFNVYDSKVALSARRFVPPSFNDIRHILNIAQVTAVRDTVRLVTFDGDKTLYEDGANFPRESPLVSDIISLMSKGVVVALVTAAGYKGRPDRYEQRLLGLMQEMMARNLPAEILSKFFVMGGECNYLFQCGPKVVDDKPGCGLTELDPSVWRIHGWSYAYRNL